MASSTVMLSLVGKEVSLLTIASLNHTFLHLLRLLARLRQQDGGDGKWSTGGAPDDVIRCLVRRCCRIQQRAEPAARQTGERRIRLLQHPA